MAMKQKNLPAIVPEVFEHEQFGNFRYIKRGEEILFVAVDLCRALDIKNVRQNLANFPDDEKADVCITYTSSNGVKQRRNVLVVTEPGFYRLIFMSRKPEAEKIKRWVFHEVLPSIRKYGYYVAPQKIEENLPELPAPNTVVKGFEEITTLMKKNGDEWYYEWIETANSNGEKKYELGLKPFPCYVAKIIWDD